MFQAASGKREPPQLGRVGYYICKYGEVRKVAQELGGDYVIKQGHYAEASKQCIC